MIEKKQIYKVLSASWAKKGTGHWWLQRLTAIALIPLSVFIIVFFDLCFNASYQQTLTWVASPINAVAIILWTVVVFYHAVLGLHVVIEDYVAKHPLQMLLLWAVNGVFLLLGCVAVVALFRIVLAR